MEDWQLNQHPSDAGTEAAPPPAKRSKNSQDGYLRLLAEAMMGGESLQRPALAQRVGLPRMAVSDLLAGLEMRGLVQVQGAIGGAPGRSQLSYALRSEAAFALGFDVGGTKVAAGLTDLGGHIVAERTEATVRTGAVDLVAQLARIAEALREEAGIPRFRLRAAAVGVPAAVHPSTAELSLAGNLPGLEGDDLRPQLSQALGMDVLIENDVNLALLAETAQAGRHEAQNVAFIALGTGIGGALMINGRLLRGAHGGAGELGYMPLWSIEAPGVPPLEERVGEAGIRRAYVAGGGDPAHSVREIFAAAEAGNGAARAALDGAMDHVARAVLSILALLDTDVIVFGGSIGSRPEFIAGVERLVSAAWSRPVHIVRSHSGGRAGMLGALELARRHMLDDLFGPLPGN